LRPGSPPWESWPPRKTDSRQHTPPSVAAQNLSADADAVDHDPYAVMVPVIVVAARRTPCHASNAAGRQRPSYDGVRLVCGYGETGGLKTPRSNKALQKRIIAIAQTSVIFFDILTMIDSLVSTNPEGRTINHYSVSFRDCAIAT
jgi:hypothetical protein